MITATMKDMNTAVDTFTRFVDVVQATLDDPDVAGSDVADRAHMSRFHFDRVISAVAGEAPARFRRRVLMERAAYRLITTKTTVLDVAVEAGYSSHEAFTRAFARAYNTTPSSWRRKPTRFQIDAPSGVHFHPPGGLRLPARTKVTAMDLVQRLVDHHVWLVGQMLDRASQLDSETLDHPITLSVESIDDHPTLRSLLSRLVGQLDMWNAALAGRAYDFSVEEDERIEQMRTRLAEAGPTFIGQVREVCEQGRLDETFVDAVCEPAEVFTYGGMIAHVLTFAAHRRTLVVGALQDAGITDLGAGDPMRWVAEEV
jgi:AraC family transcriptional regulator